MENKLEQLLNSLIEKGWKPFGESRIEEINRAEQYAGNWDWCCRGRKDAIQKRKSTRQLVSKESGLWQFVCENRMVDKEHKRPAYRLIESSLKDESELEEFLLSNIKVDANN